MSGDERTFEDRYEACAKSLAAALDIPAVMAVRAEIVALVCAVGDDPSRRRELSRARKLRRDAELAIGEMLIDMRARGLRRTEGGNHQADSRPTLADLGLRDARPERWQARARAKAIRTT
jgi:hypothetical protein